MGERPAERASMMHAYVASQVSFWTLALLAGLVLVVVWGMKR